MIASAHTHTVNRAAAVFHDLGTEQHSDSATHYTLLPLSLLARTLHTAHPKFSGTAWLLRETRTLPQGYLKREKKSQKEGT